MDPEFIKVRFDDQELSLPLNSKGNLKLSVLKQYFPQASGLTYSVNNEKCGLPIESEEILINRKIEHYDVHVGQDLKNSITSKKRKLVHEMIDKIQLGQGVNSSKTHMTKMKNKWADSTVVSAQPTLKKVRLGWLVKRGDRYEQMKKPLGGVREVPLEVGKRYLVSDIKKIAMEEFSCNSEVSFHNSDVRLGLIDRTVLTSFRDSKGIACDLWTFLKEQKSRLFTLYIITSPKECAQTCDQLKTIQYSHHENPNPQLSQRNKVLKRSTAISHKNSAPLKNNIFITYEVISQSEYTQDYCICYLLKNDLYNHKFDEYG
ncbi:GSCOCG00012793001-RA-CDS, partial [Cotesia congregata]